MDYDRSDRIEKLLQEARTGRQLESEELESEEKVSEGRSREQCRTIDRAKAIEDINWSGSIILILTIIGMIAIVAVGVVIIVIGYGPIPALVLWIIGLPLSYVGYVFTRGIIRFANSFE